MIKFRILRFEFYCDAEVSMSVLELFHIKVNISTIKVVNSIARVVVDSLCVLRNSLVQNHIIVCVVSSQMVVAKTKVVVVKSQVFNITFILVYECLLG